MRTRFRRFALVVSVLALVTSLACGAEPSAVASISQQQLASLADSQDAPLILDVRTPEEFAAGHVPGAVNIPHTEVAARLDEVEPYRARGVVVYCERGRRAGEAAEVLADAGFPDLRELDGHMTAWRTSGLPVEE